MRFPLQSKLNFPTAVPISLGLSRRPPLRVLAEPLIWYELQAGAKTELMEPQQAFVDCKLTVWVSFDGDERTEFAVADLSRDTEHCY